MRSKEETLTLIVKTIIQCQKGCFVNAEHKIVHDETQWNDLEDGWYDFIEGEFDAYASEVLRDFAKQFYADEEACRNNVENYLKTK